MIAADGINCVIVQDVDRLFRQDKERVRFDELDQRPPIPVVPGKASKKWADRV